MIKNSREFAFKNSFVRIEDLREDTSDKIFYECDLDQFDTKLFEESARKYDSSTIFMIKHEFNSMAKFHFSKKFYSNVKESFDTLSYKPPFNSIRNGINVTETSYGNFKKLSYKNKDLSLHKIKKFEISMLDDFNQTRYVNLEDTKIEYDSDDNEKQLFNDAKMKKRRHTNFKPTHFAKISNRKETSDINISKSIITENLPNYDARYLTDCNKEFNQTLTKSTFVEELFKKYGYEELDPFKMAQMRTKNNLVCLFELKSIYNKICDLFS